MKKKSLKYFILSGVCFLIFVIYTICVKFVDVAQIGPNNSSVGFSTINSFVHNLFGVNFTIYNITDWGGVVALIPAVVFAIIGLIQLIKRKSIKKVDKNIMALGIFYIATILVYIFFEFVVINRRPVLINGYLEASYPSSTTILSLTFLLSLIYQINVYVSSKKVNICLQVVTYLYCAFLVVGRLVSGVHWFTDILGGIIISIALLLFYYGLLYTFKSTSRLEKAKEVVNNQTKETTQEQNEKEN